MKALIIHGVRLTAINRLTTNPQQYVAPGRGRPAINMEG